ncbi:hypothetical protein BLNAU_19711 [Blattamonas nauphoetae]|uniref:Uncharacterized protein n=1 Tax=Blattamonas nauphoetae TaxID=2049346 RepID=A0ABQ9X0S6_9EUKA|nr:hypothetical protein BLNAU_19711 [Blattamonas nauphoetae]
MDDVPKGMSFMYHDTYLCVACGSFVDIWNLTSDSDQSDGFLFEGQNQLQCLSVCDSTLDDEWDGVVLSGDSHGTVRLHSLSSIGEVHLSLQYNDPIVAVQATSTASQIVVCTETDVYVIRPKNRIRQSPQRRSMSPIQQHDYLAPKHQENEDSPSQDSHSSFESDSGTEDSDRSSESESDSETHPSHSLSSPDLDSSQHYTPSHTSSFVSTFHSSDSDSDHSSSSSVNLRLPLTSPQHFRTITKFRPQTTPHPSQRNRPVSTQVLTNKLYEDARRREAKLEAKRKEQEQQKEEDLKKARKVRHINKVSQKLTENAPSLFEKSERYNEQRKTKLEGERKKEEEAIMKEVTGTPKINKVSQKMERTLDQLYTQAVEKKKNKLQMAEDTKKKEAEEEVKGLFVPNAQKKRPKTATESGGQTTWDRLFDTAARQQQKLKDTIEKERKMAADAKPIIDVKSQRLAKGRGKEKISERLYGDFERQKEKKELLLKRREQECLKMTEKEMDQEKEKKKEARRKESAWNKRDGMSSSVFSDTVPMLVGDPETVTLPNPDQTFKDFQKMVARTDRRRKEAEEDQAKRESERHKKLMKQGRKELQKFLDMQKTKRPRLRDEPQVTPPARRFDPARTEELYQSDARKRMEREQWVAREQKKKEEAELLECTFKPTITPPSDTHTTAREVGRNADEARRADDAAVFDAFSHDPHRWEVGHTDKDADEALCSLFFRLIFFRETSNSVSPVKVQEQPKPTQPAVHQVTLTLQAESKPPEQEPNSPQTESRFQDPNAKNKKRMGGRRGG